MDFAEQQGWNVVGVDINRDKLRRAQQHHSDSARYGSIYELDWPDSHFDAIRLCHVLEHLTEPKAAIVSLGRVLRTGGILNVGVPVFDDRIYWLSSEKTPHICYRSHLISHKSYPTDQSIHHRARYNLINPPAAHR